ncbi:DUF1611 domain-containing protein [Paremcibacter congregatus]|uniref:EBNA-1 nuclear protein n=1 Tax=Paremcibacter congregatus TaxID=2043170 RepID=A0A2G4YW80_9PROT|nr:DUF1611 domain-containing protein [Paremcibacter congregatus]PHZ86602.1 EBNA-1 nuclear protein [Paremcibacter congregatus]QDE26405.1 DUF1611 domain-containing protein [Paremcibacter congregatus]
MKTIELKPPYLIFVGDAVEESYAKTGFGMIEWRRELCKGQIRLPGCQVDLGIPSLTLDQAVAEKVGSLLIGTAAVGGRIPESWLDTLVEFVEKGIDIVAGVHTRLNDIPRLRAAADQSGARLIDVRVPPEDIAVGTGRKRSGRRLLTVGTDCALGKKYTALALEKDMQAQNMKADFCASGQTGIMIAGKGIPIDAVVADFISGAAEQLSPDNAEDHWDVVEGQGSLFHPGYSAVSLGLLIGSQPDAFVVCHKAGRHHIMGWPDFEVPTIEDVIERTINIGRQVNREIRCVGVSVNTSSLSEDMYGLYLDDLSAKTGLPCVDPLRDGTRKIVNRLLMEFPNIGRNE